MPTSPRFLGTAIALSQVLLLTTAGPALAQQCLVGTAGPFTLKSGQTLKVCATNLDARTSRRFNVALYDAFRARAPLRLDYVNLEQGEGTCLSFRPPPSGLTMVVRTGYLLDASDPGPPLALSVQLTHGSTSEGQFVHTFNFGIGLPEDPPV